MDSVQSPSIARCFTILAIGLLVTTASACLSSQTVKEPRSADDLDRKLSTFAWIEDGKLAAFIVGTRAARYREEANYLPISICLANRGIRNLTVNLEGFTLMDEEGNRYPAATPEELLEGYQFLDLDQSPQLQELPSLVADKFAAYRFYPSNFSPTRGTGRGTTRSRMSLPRYGYIVDNLYFPHPAGGVVGKRFELFFNAPELENPIFVKFEVR